MSERLLTSAAVKLVARKAASSFLNFHLPGPKKDILILASPRSGSTWLMELINSQPLFKFINEPLNKDLLDYAGLLPIETRWNYLNLTDFEEEVLEEYFKNDKKISIFGPPIGVNPDFRFVTNRRVLKVIRANALISWFLNTFDFHLVYLIRHPIARAISSIKRGHQGILDDYGTDPQFARDYLSSEMTSWIETTRRKGTLREKFVTGWCLENMIPLKVREERKEEFLTISYEELVACAEPMVDLLCRELQLPSKSAIIKRTNVPSQVTDSSSTKTRISIRRGDPRFLIEKWKNQIPADEEEELLTILDIFGIDAYSPGSFFAKEDLLHFADCN